MLKRLLWVMLCFLIIPGVFAGTAHAAADTESASGEMGLVTKLHGNVSYKKQGNEKWNKAMLFMKVRLGDGFYLFEKGSLRIVYFDNGRIETWLGPSEFRVGPEGGKSKGESSPKVEKVDVSASRETVVAANVLQKFGAWVSRRGPKGESSYASISEEEKEQIIARYEELKKSAEQDDPLPEIYLFSALIKRGDYDTAEKYIKEALKESPHSEALKEMLSYLERE